MRSNPIATVGPGPVRIVVVEDDEAFRQSMKRSLELAGYDVSAFTDAESAMAQLSAIEPAMVLTDLRLPKADGLCMLKQAKA